MKAMQGLAPRLSEAARRRLPHLKMFYHGDDWPSVMRRANASATLSSDATTAPAIHIRTNNPIIEGAFE